MDKFIDGLGDTMVCRYPIGMTASKDSVAYVCKGIGWGILEPFEKEVGIISRLSRQRGNDAMTTCIKLTCPS
jgi:hypothetical protein